MPNSSTIGTVRAQPGEVARGGIPIMGDMYSRPREIPIIVYHGVEDGPILWLNGATQGDEPHPVIEK